MSRYSLLYIEPGPRKDDSPRARRRLSARLEEGHGSDYIAIYRRIEVELGYRFKRTVPIYAIREFFDEAGISDILDAITLIYNVVKAGNYGDRSATAWVNFVGRLFAEENLNYKIDGRGVVHPFIDIEFDNNRSATLGALNENRFGEARADFEAAFHHLRDGQGKAAIRMMFPAVESAAKVLFPGSMSRLMPNEVERCIAPKLRGRYAGNQPAIEAGNRLLEGLKDWIIASQPYRHGQEQEEPSEPPDDLVVMFLSEGAAYLRWMVELCSGPGIVERREPTR